MCVSHKKCGFKGVAILAIMYIHAIMPYKTLSFMRPLEDYAEYLEKLSMRTIDRLAPMVENAVSFSDPVFNVNNCDAVLKILGKRLTVFSYWHYRVHDFSFLQNIPGAFVYWSVKAQGPDRGLLNSILINKQQSYAFEGVSRVVFNPDGRINTINEYWGMGHVPCLNVYEGRSKDLQSVKG